jgi:hypothetical protein
MNTARAQRLVNAVGKLVQSSKGCDHRLAVDLLRVAAALLPAAWSRRLLETRDSSGHEHKGTGPGGGQFTGTGGGGSDSGTATSSAGKSSTATAPSTPKPKAVRMAGRYRDCARRRRVIAAVRVEAELADAIDGYNLPDSEPADVIYAEDATGKRLTTRTQVKDFLSRREAAVRVLNNRNASPEARASAERVLELPCHFVEVKTLLVSAKSAVHMSHAARKRKERWQNRYGASFSVVAVDDRRGKKHSGHRIHVAVGELAGTFNLHQMDKADSLGAVLSKLCPECGARAS